MGTGIMSEITKKENEWQDKATAVAITAVRKIALNSSGLPPMTPVGRLTDLQWGWLVTAAIFGWIQTRCQQAIEEGLDQEQAVRLDALLSLGEAVNLNEYGRATSHLRRLFEVLGVERKPRDLSSDLTPDDYISRLPVEEPASVGEVVEESVP
jgi:hypothetical protein